MNRIKISPLATAAPDSIPMESSPAPSIEQFKKLTRRSDDEFSLFVPLHYEENYAYPLIVWLHADGEKPGQIQHIIQQTSLRNYVGVAPQAPVGNFETGYYWEQETDTIDLAHNAIMSAIDSATMRFNVATQRVFIAGAGTGGTMAFRIALQRPDIFAGVISVNGPMPDNEKPLGQWARCRNIPVFWAHSRRSTQFGQDELCRQLRLLHIAGFAVTLRQYPSDECLGTKTLSDMNQWIMGMIDSSVGN